MQKHKKTSRLPKIGSVKQKCNRIHAKLVTLQKAIEKAHRKSAGNCAWQGLLDSAIKGMDDALSDLEKRLDHIRQETREILPVVFVALLAGTLLTGCVHLQEGAKQVWGTSVAHLERARVDAPSVLVKVDGSQAFEQARKLLQDKGAAVYLVDKDKRYLAAQNFSGYVDTTQVGLFFTLQDGGVTKIEAASLSPWLAEDVAGYLSQHFNVAVQKASVSADAEYLSGIITQ